MHPFDLASSLDIVRARPPGDERRAGLLDVAPWALPDGYRLR